MKTMMNALPRLGAIALTAVAASAFVACDTAEILEVIDPDLVTPENIQGEKGASLFWAGALGEFSTAYSGNGTGQVMYVAMFTDEMHLSGTFPTRNEVDRREIDRRNGTMTGVYRDLHQARVALENATLVLEEFVPGDSRIAEMYNLAGFTYLFFGENYCEGVPYGETPAQGDLVDGTPTTKAETFGRALERFGSARAATGGSSDQEYLARVGAGRAQLDMGNFSAAAGEVGAVPTDWVYEIHHKGGGAFNQRNSIYELNQSQRRWSVSDMEGGVGASFRSALDPRVPWEDNGGIGFDEGTPLYEQLKFPSWDAEVPLATGVDARLIEAEAALATGDATGWLAIHNALRADIGLAALADPGTDRDRWMAHFSEHGMWTYTSAQRLGMARRMMKYHGFTEDEVLPNGTYFKGGAYGNDVNFPIPFVETENPNFNECTNRAP